MRIDKNQRFDRNKTQRKGNNKRKKDGENKEPVVPSRLFCVYIALVITETKRKEKINPEV
jgi:hypothetical protein